jgi:hypothetical protein
MKKVVTIYDSSEMAEKATQVYWASQTSKQRLEAMFTIRHQWVKENERRILRTYQIIEIP